MSMMVEQSGCTLKKIIGIKIKGEFIMIKFINRMLINSMVTIVFVLAIFAAVGVDPSQMIGQVIQSTDILQNLKSQSPLQGLLNQIDQATR